MKTDTSHKIIVAGMVTAILGMIIALIATFALGMGALTYYMWNWLAVDLFDADRITFWQGVGLYVAIAIVGGLFRARVTVRR